MVHLSLSDPLNHPALAEAVELRTPVDYLYYLTAEDQNPYPVIKKALAAAVERKIRSAKGKQRGMSSDDRMSVR